MKFSVIVCTYNSSEESVVYTLDSIIDQNFDDFEIIVCDDGSEDNKEELIKEYFRNKKFEKYKLIMNCENRGTVRNVISGMECAEGEYIKSIGAGDALSDNEVLSSMYCYMKNNNASFVFSDMNIFTICNGNRVNLEKNIPISKNKYVKANYLEKMKENIIVYNDQISGASMFFEKKIILEYFLRIKDIVIYIEDLIQYLFLLDGLEIFYYNRKCVDYEVGEGISTKKESKNNCRMLRDKTSFLDYIFIQYSDNKYVKRRRKLEKIEHKKQNKLLKVICKFFAEPKWAYYRLKKR